MSCFTYFLRMMTAVNSAVSLMDGSVWILCRKLFAVTLQQQALSGGVCYSLGQSLSIAFCIPALLYALCLGL